MVESWNNHSSQIVGSWQSWTLPHLPLPFNATTTNLWGPNPPPPNKNFNDNKKYVIMSLFSTPPPPNKHTLNTLLCITCMVRVVSTGSIVLKFFLRKTRRFLTFCKTSKKNYVFFKILYRLTFSTIFFFAIRPIDVEFNAERFFKMVTFSVGCVLYDVFAKHWKKSENFEVFFQYGGRSSHFWRGKTQCSVFGPKRKRLNSFPAFPQLFPFSNLIWLAQWSTVMWVFRPFRKPSTTQTPSTEPNIGCPTTYQTRKFFNHCTTNEDIATKFEADLPHCVRNVTTS
jgi:hypothetical protein